MKEIEVSIDLSNVQAFSEKACDLLARLRDKYDLSNWEFTDRIRIAPLEIPHSHPVLTLNTQHLHNEDAFLSVYLHEQIHWGWSDNFGKSEEEIISELRQKYPNLHCGDSGEAADEFSTYLHIIINWLEIHALTDFMGRTRAEEIVRQFHYYQKIYQLVLNNWDQIEAILKAHKILPFPKAG